MFFENIEQQIQNRPTLFRLFTIGFPLYERAWTLRGMENLMMDFALRRDYVDYLFKTISEISEEALIRNKTQIPN